MNGETPTILYRDAYLLAVHKPAGVMVHRSPIAGRGERFLLQMVRNRIGHRVYPVHRLDKPTSGVLLFGLDPDTAGRMAGRFARREVKKFYLAVVRGFVEEKGSVDLPLRGDVYRRKETQEFKSARTAYRRLAQIEVDRPVGPYATARYSLLRVEPETGRMHQIRRHLRDISHPVIGDRRYGDNRHNRFFKEELDCPRLLLAAVQLGFDHPVSGQRLTIFDPVADAFAQVLRRFGWLAAIPGQWRSVEPGPERGEASEPMI